LRRFACVGPGDGICGDDINTGLSVISSTAGLETVGEATDAGCTAGVTDRDRDLTENTDAGDMDGDAAMLPVKHSNTQCNYNDDNNNNNTFI